MKRIIMIVFKVLYKVPYWFYMLCQHAKDTNEEKYSMQQKYDLIREIAVKASKAGNVVIEKEGLENIPEENGYVIYPNHQGMYDPLVLLETLDAPFGLVFKKEVENIILLKQCKESMHYLPMDRDDLKQSAKVILEVTKRVKAGENFAIFAEGTRSKNGNVIGTFKAGAFKAATKAKAPILPVALVNCFMPFDSGTTKQVNVKVRYLKPMLYEEYKEMNTTEIAEEVEKRIRQAIAEMTA